MADELDWLEMLVASERVEKWLGTICSSGASTAVKIAALQEFAAAVQGREAYAEEARHAGAVTRLTSQLSNWADNLALRQAAVKACTQLELASAFRQQVSTVQYGDIAIKLKEGALGDGLGARVWVVAHTLCRHLIAHPEVVAGKRVIEIGAGCGLCGMLAVKLQAREVFLTDYEQKVLDNLRDCVAMNFSAQTSGGSSSGHVPESSHLQTAAQQNEDEFGDPDDAESCDDMDDLFAFDDQGAASASTASATWDYGNVHVRHLDWQEAVDSESRAMSSGAPGTESTGAAVNESNTKTAPKSGTQDKYDVILGTDILYEAAHAPLVAAVVRQQLAADGQALLCCAVREQAIFNQFATELTNRHLQFVIKAIQPQVDDQGIIGKQHDYEGGFVMLTIQHAE